MTIVEIFKFIVNPHLTGTLLTLKIVFLAVSFVFAAFIVFALIKTTWFKRLVIWDLQELLTVRHHAFTMTGISKTWHQIKMRMEAGTEPEAKLALIEADALLDDILRRLKYPGESLGDRLEKMSTDVISNLDEIKKAHQTRNNIIHDPSYRLDVEEAKTIVAAYEKSLFSLEAL